MHCVALRCVVLVFASPGWEYRRRAIAWWVAHHTKGVMCLFQQATRGGWLVGWFVRVAGLVPLKPHTEVTDAAWVAGLFFCENRWQEARERIESI